MSLVCIKKAAKNGMEGKNFTYTCAKPKKKTETKKTKESKKK